MITTSRREKRFIHDQVTQLGARRVLEIGCFKGQTTRILSEAVGSEGVVVAVDPMRWSSRPAHVWEWLDGILHPSSYEAAFQRNVARSGIDNVRLFKCLSQDEELLADPDPVLRDLDLVFIDGEHLYESAMNDFRSWGARVRSGGRVLLHDCIDRFPGVQRAVREIAETAGCSVTWPTASSGSIASVDIQRTAVTAELLRAETD